MTKTDATPQSQVIKTYKLNDLHIDPRLLVPMRTGTGLDTIISDDGALMPGMVIMAIGDPGVGKSTLMTQIIGQADTLRAKLMKEGWVKMEVHMDEYHNRKAVKGLDFDHKGNQVPSNVTVLCFKDSNDSKKAAKDDKGKELPCIPLMYEKNKAFVEIRKLKVLSISSEMNAIDTYFTIARENSVVGQVETLFLGDYDEPSKVLREKLSEGFDIVALDSFEDIYHKVREELEITRGGGETFILNLMDDMANGRNASNRFTSFLCIQQVNKNGSFVGSNRIKHMTTGMLEMRFEKTGERFCEFTKNRRCGQHVNKKLYMRKNEKEKLVEFDIDRFHSFDKDQRRSVTEGKKFIDEGNKMLTLFKNTGKMNTIEVSAADPTGATVTERRTSLRADNNFGDEDGNDE